MSVEWKLFDRAQQKVVATVVTSGQAAQDKFSTHGLARLIDGAFVNSLRALTDKAEVQAIVGAPAAGTPAAVS